MQLLVGAPLDPALLANSLEQLDAGVANASAGWSSDLLLGRPDVVEAEHALRAANADIGSARAAYFPRISLTAAAGVASSGLVGLLGDEGRNWSTGLGASMPLLGGSVAANRRYSEARRVIALARYEQVIQSAFRDVGDALSRHSRLASQLRAQNGIVAAVAQTLRMISDRYEAGISSSLDLLDAQRSLYAVQQAARVSRAQAIVIRLDLWKALGGQTGHASCEGP